MKSSGKIVLWFTSLIIVVLTAACGTVANEKTPTNEGTAATEQSGAGDKHRVVESIKGDITIPANPRSVVGTTVTYPDFLYALGVTPVAAENYHDDFASYFQEAFKDVIKLGNNSGPDFERLLAAAPDLILAPKWRDENNYDQLSKIAPTVLLPDREDWRDELRDIGSVLNLSEKAEKAIQSYENSTAESKAKLAALIGEETVSYMRITPKGSLIFGIQSYRGKVIHEELGLKPVDAFPSDQGSVEVSLEVLPEYNPDHIILQIDGGADAEQAKKVYADMADTSVWKSMKAVKEGHVYMVGDNEWFNFGYSPIANLYAIDQIVSEFEGNK